MQSIPDHQAAPKPPQLQPPTCHELYWSSTYRTGLPASPYLPPDNLETVRHIQTFPEMSSYVQTIAGPSRAIQALQKQCGTSWNHRKHPGCLIHLKHLENKSWGHCQWLNPFLNVWHMCVTSPPIGLHQRHPVGLPLSVWTRGPE